MQSYTFISTTSIDFQTFSLKAGDSFLYRLNQLPTSFEQNPEEYQTFIEFYGTHYIESAHLGGVFMHEIIVNEKPKPNDTQNILKILKLFKENKFDSTIPNTEFHIKYFGGQADLLDPSEEEIKRWQVKMVPKIPWTYSVIVRPLWRLVPNITIQNELKRAIRQKINKANLMEAKNLLQILVDKYKPLNINSASTCTPETLLNQVEHYIKHPFYKSNETLQIQRNVFQLYDIYQKQQCKACMHLTIYN